MFYAVFFLDGICNLVQQLNKRVCLVERIVILFQIDPFHSFPFRF